MPKVACVTGANKGIGFETVKLLCQKLKPAEDWKVLLTARCLERGEKALKALEAEKLPIHPVYVQLNIRDKKQCEALRDRVKKEFGGLDMLVNNAAIGYRRISTVPVLEQMHETLQTNYFGTKLVTETLLPVLRDKARVITVASSEAERAFRTMDVPLRQKMLAPDLTLEELDRLMLNFMEETEKNPVQGSLTFYSLSKAAVVTWTRICAQLAKEGRLPGLQAKDVSFFSCNPGWCKSDMAGWEEPPLSAADGGVAVVDVCLNAKQDAEGEYIDHGVIVKLHTG